MLWATPVLIFMLFLSNSFDVRPDLVQNFLQKLSADDTSRQRVKAVSVLLSFLAFSFFAKTDFVVPISSKPLLFSHSLFVCQTECCLLITFSNSLDRDQAQQNVGPYRIQTV